jgi:hypothetical protein
MLDAVSDTTEKYFCMNMIVCDVKSYVCMMKRCESCPGTEPLILFLKSQIGDLSVIRFKQWESTDRTILENTELPTTEFFTLLVKKIDCLTVHDYVSKAQSKFCRELKQSLPLNECLLQGDFSQKYSMISQDSIQS